MGIFKLLPAFLKPLTLFVNATFSTLKEQETSHEAETFPSSDCAVIVAVPAPQTVITPSSTVNKDLSELLHLIVLSVAFSG